MSSSMTTPGSNTSGPTAGLPALATALAPALEAKYRRLRDLLADLGSALVCFSGGVDSTLLLRVAHDVLGDRCVAFTTASETMAQSEQREATELAALIGARHEVVRSQELVRP